MSDLDAAIERLGKRDPSRSEASIQSDIRLVLLLADLGLDDDDLAVDLEVPAAGGRIDILVGQTVIEVKKDLTKPGVSEAARIQLGGYFATRIKTVGGWHVGILTDGVLWQFVQLGETGEPQTVGALEAGSDGHDPQQLLAWLRAVVGLTPPVPPYSRTDRRSPGSPEPVTSARCCPIEGAVRHLSRRPRGAAKARAMGQAAPDGSRYALHEY